VKELIMRLALKLLWPVPTRESECERKKLRLHWDPLSSMKLWNVEVVPTKVLVQNF